MNIITASPVETGGYIYPGTGKAGFIQQSSNIPYFQGHKDVTQIPAFQRTFNERDVLIRKVREGRMPMMRVMLEASRMNGVYVTNDVRARYPVEHAPHPRFYLKVKANQGTTKTSTAKTGTFVLANKNDVKRLQTNDLCVLMCQFVPPTRDADTVSVTYVESPSGSNEFKAKRDPTAVVQEVFKITNVNYDTGVIEVIRNMTPDSVTTTRKGIGFTVVADDTVQPGTDEVRASNAFFVRAANVLGAGSDDQKIYNRTITWDYNLCQYVMRKWGSDEIEEAVAKKYQSAETTMQKNARDTNEDFWEEMEYLNIYGFRYEDIDERKKWRGHMGGFLENLNPNHIVTLEEPDYSDPSKMGDFTIPYINKAFEDKFYYGAQDKVLVCGARWHTAFSIMINNMTNNIPTIVDKWSVLGRYFQTSNGGRFFVVPSDIFSLNGNDDIALLMDPTTYRYGHLENLDIRVVNKLPQNNIHLQEGEIYGVVTSERTNPDANWMFVLKPNQE